MQLLRAWAVHIPAAISHCPGTHSRPSGCAAAALQLRFETDATHYSSWERLCLQLPSLTVSLSPSDACSSEEIQPYIGRKRAEFFGKEVGNLVDRWKGV